MCDQSKKYDLKVNINNDIMIDIDNNIPVTERYATEGDTVPSYVAEGYTNQSVTPITPDDLNLEEKHQPYSNHTRMVYQNVLADIKETIKRTYSLQVITNPNDMLDQYTVINESLFGTVYKAFYKPTQQWVIVKKSNKKTLERTKLFEDVYKEGYILRHIKQTIARIEHINDQDYIALLKYIFPVFINEFETDTDHYLITDFVKAKELFECYNDINQKPIQISAVEETAQLIFRQLVLGVKFLHDNNIAHMDLSLENILIDDEYNIRIIDFGLAIIHPACINNFGDNLYYHLKFKPIKPISDKNAIPGKPMYTSPELYHSEKWDARASDIYSLGIILHILTTYQVPYRSLSHQGSKYFLEGAWKSALDIIQNRDKNAFAQRTFNCLNNSIVDYMKKYIVLSQDVLMLLHKTMGVYEKKRFKIDKICTSRFILP
jgi:serine/threonine protein kinase